jgi:hypothetical protein
MIYRNLLLLILHSLSGVRFAVCAGREGGREREVLVAKDMLYPWHGARNGLASCARHRTNQHQNPFHHRAEVFTVITL